MLNIEGTKRIPRISVSLTLSGLICIILNALTASAALPDLVIDKPLLAGSVEIQKATFAGADCAVVESCIATGNRRLLKFDVGFKNIGRGDLVIGDPNARPDLFESSPCHGHFHMKGAANYELVNSSGQTVLRARKQAFCFRDNVQFDGAAGPAQYDCDFQGITAGWEDIYDKSLDCQWLDITGIAGGTYLLRVTVNPEGIFQESNYGNNAATVSINLPGAAPQPQPQPPQTQPPSGSQPGVKKGEPEWKKLNDKFKKNKKKKHKHKKHKPQPVKDDDQGEDHDDHEGENKE
jgi:hypothetical protein